MSYITNQAAVEAIAAIAGSVAALSVSMATASGAAVPAVRNTLSGNTPLPLKFSQCTPETAKAAAELRWRKRQAEDARLRYGDPFWNRPNPPGLNQDTAQDKQLRKDFGPGQFEIDYVMLQTNPLAAMVYAFRTTVYGESHRTAIMHARRGGGAWGLLSAIATPGVDRQAVKEQYAKDVHPNQLDGRPNIH